MSGDFRPNRASNQDFRPPPVPGEDAVIRLGQMLEAGRLDRRAALHAKSILHAWSRQELTDRQYRKVQALIGTAAPRPGETRSLPPVPYKSGEGWWQDTSPARQALRGIKSGIVRRWKTRERDETICRLRRLAGKTVAALATLYGLCERQIRNILRREREGVDMSRRTRAPSVSVLWKRTFYVTDIALPAAPSSGMERPELFDGEPSASVMPSLTGRSGGRQVPFRA